MVAVSVSIVVDLALCVLQQVARKGVEPLFPPYQSGALNRWTTGLYDLRLLIADLRLSWRADQIQSEIGNRKSEISLTDP